MSEVRYPFDGAFQNKILALILRDRSFLTRHRAVVQPGFFDSPYHAVLCRQVFEYYDKYRLTPSREAISELIRGHKDADLLQELIDQLFTIDLSDAVYIEQVSTKFARQQAVKRAFRTAEGMLGDADFDGIRQEIDKALLIGTQHENLGTDFWGSIEEMMDDLSDNTEAEVRIPTLITELDKQLDGGIYPGELNLVMAPSGRGKSIFLVNMAYAALWLRKNVLFITLEMSDYKIRKRLVSRFTGVNPNSLAGRVDEVYHRLQMFRKKSGHLQVKGFPTGYLTVDELRAYTLSLGQATGFVPDLLVVDSLDIMRPIGSASLDDSFKGQGQIAKGLRGLATEFQVGLWSATQGNRASAKKAVLDAEDKAESYRVVQDADVIIGLMRTAEEKERCLGRLSIAKGRDLDIVNPLMTVGMDYTRMFIGDPKVDA